MEQSLKARLIGATILVVLAVILVPELLSGRKATGEAPATSDSQGSRTFTIELGGTESRPAGLSPASAAPAATVGNIRAAGTTAGGDGTAKAPSSAPVRQEAPRGTVPPPSAVAVEPQQVVGTAPRPTTPPTPADSGGATTVAPVPPDRPSGDGWLVQVGAFGSADAARSLVKDLEAAGLAAHVSPVTRGGRTLHRVRVGPVAGRGEALRLAARLEARGLPATLVAGE